MFGVGIHAILFCTPLIRHLVVVMFTAFTNPLTSRCRNRSVMLTFGIQTHYEAIVQLNKFLHKIYFIGRFFSRSTPINPMNSIDLNCVIIAGGLYHMFQCLCWFVFGFELHCEHCWYSELVRWPQGVRWHMYPLFACVLVLMNQLDTYCCAS